jgi:hypothetical protein
MGCIPNTAKDIAVPGLRIQNSEDIKISRGTFVISSEKVFYDEYITGNSISANDYCELRLAVNREPMIKE